MGLLNKPIGKGKGKKGKSGDVQLKTYINFAEKSAKKKENWLLAVPGVIAIVALAFLFGKYVIADMYSRVDVAEAEVNNLQNRLNSDMSMMSSASSLNYEFYHHTWTDMNDTEKARTHRTYVMELVQEIGQNGIDVKSMGVSENVISLSVETDTLDRLNEFAKELTARDTIENVSVSSARATTKDAEGGFKNRLEAQLKINLNDLDTGRN